MLFSYIPSATTIAELARRRVFGDSHNLRPPSSMPNVHSEGRAPLLRASLSTVGLDLGLMKTPVPRFICVAKGIPFRVGQCKTELFRVQRKPPERFGVREHPIQRQATQRGYIDGTSGVMFAEPRRRTHRQNSVDTQPTFEFFANDFGLPLKTTECRSNLQI